jgi:uncharacterized protein (DUF924 family)
VSGGPRPLATAREVLAFWREAGPEKWFVKDDGLDTEIRRRFLATHEAAARGELAQWERVPDGALALVILLDQFPRNMFRGDKRTFATDALALAAAQAAIAHGFDRQVEPELRTFFYVPFMHSERLADQERCVALYRAVGDDYSLKFAEEHADIIRRFGRFPHRNAVLARATTPEEQAFLDSGGFAG